MVKNLVFPRIFLYCVSLPDVVSGLLLSAWFVVRAYSVKSKFTAFKNKKILKFRKWYLWNGKLLQVAKILSRNGDKSNSIP